MAIKIDFDILDECVLDNIVDYDVYNSRPKRVAKEKTEVEIKQRDIPELQKELVVVKV